MGADATRHPASLCRLGVGGDVTLGVAKRGSSLCSSGVDGRPGRGSCAVTAFTPRQHVALEVASAVGVFGNCGGALGAVGSQVAAIDLAIERWLPPWTAPQWIGDADG